MSTDIENGESPAPAEPVSSEQLAQLFEDVRAGDGHAVELSGVRLMKQEGFEKITNALDDYASDTRTLVRQNDALSERCNDLRVMNHQQHQTISSQIQIIKLLSSSGSRAVLKQAIIEKQREINDMVKLTDKLRDERDEAKESLSDAVDSVGRLKEEIALMRRNSTSLQYGVDEAEANARQLRSFNEALQVENERLRNEAARISFEADSLRDTEEIMSAYQHGYLRSVRNRAPATHRVAHEAGRQASRIVREKQGESLEAKEAPNG